MFKVKLSLLCGIKGNVSFPAINFKHLNSSPYFQPHLICAHVFTVAFFCDTENFKITVFVKFLFLQQIAGIVSLKKKYSICWFTF